MNVFESAFEFRYALLPCLLGYVIFDIPILWRRVTRKLYAPIYFTFFPLGYSDELYGKYLDEDFYGVLGEPLEARDLPAARHRIIAYSIISLVLTILISPFLCALYANYFLSTSEFTQLFWTLAIIKSILLIKSLYDLSFRYRVTDIVPIKAIAALYVVYLTLILIIFTEVYDWVGKATQEGGIKSVASGALEFIVIELGVKVVIVALLGWAISTKLTSSPSDSLK